MSLHGLTRFAAALLLLAAAEGCRSLPPVSEHAQATGKMQEGIPLEKVFPGLTHDPELTGGDEQASSEVVQASATEPKQSLVQESRRSAVPEMGRLDEDEDAGFQLSDLAPSNVYKNLKAAAGYGPNEQVARGLLAEGKELYAAKRYDEAASRFKSAAARWPDSTLEEDALFMAGESYFFADEYPKANDFYERMLKKYEYSDHLDLVVKRLFAIGHYWEQLYTADPSWPVEPNFFDDRRPIFDTWGNAIKAYEMVRLHDPTGPLADDAVMASANAHFLKGHFEEASYNYDLLRKEYPRSEHQVPAHLLSMKSKMSMYQGPLYDGAPLEKAGEIAEQTLTQFGTELGDQRELVLRTKNLVVEEKAARDWAVAQYYDKKQCYGAARIYYRAIIEDYPNTAAAQQAGARLQEIRDYPDQPPDHFGWLGKLFPKDDEPARRSPHNTPLDWISGAASGAPAPSEEFRDERTP
jgi:outer membrane protein assembly factor BamD (BamD/ComL family)